MPKFTVFITRDTSETGVITVEAKTEEEADKLAWAEYNRRLIHDTDFDFYQPDDYAGTPYISDTEEAE